MIIDALNRYYKNLQAQNLVPMNGWSIVKVCGALDIDEKGKLVDIIDLRNKNEKGKLLPQTMNLPNPVVRSNQIKPNMFFDNIEYITGLNIESPEKGLKKFESMKETHIDLLKSCDEPIAKAIVAYFENWKPEYIDDFDQTIINELSKGNLIFSYKGEFLHENTICINLLNKKLNSQNNSNMKEMICCITGEKTFVPAIHNKIKGLIGSQSAYSLVSINIESACSYGKEQCYNSPMKKEIADNYVNAINYLIQNKNYYNIDNTTLLYWSESASQTYNDIFNNLFETNNNISTEELNSIIEKIKQGKPVDINTQLNSNEKIYLLALATNGGRAVIKEFYTNSFGNIIKNIQAHYERLKLTHYDTNTKSKTDNPYKLTPFVIMKETSKKPKNKKEKQEINQYLIKDLIQSIIRNKPYPESLYMAIQNQAKKECGENDIAINYKKVAIIKAYLMANPITPKQIKEVLTVALQPENDNKAYILGRMFALIENVQKKASDTTSISQKYFTSASTMPATIYPMLIDLTKMYASKFKRKHGKEPYEMRIISSLMNKLDEYPKYFNQFEQGAFQIGYYHQREDLFTKHEKTDENSNKENKE